MKQILYVDHETAFARSVADDLEDQDDQFVVETVPTASDGLNRLAETSFDCVVSEYALPDLDGLELLAAARERDPGIPFVLFTDHGSERIASDAISAGVTDYQEKGRPDQSEMLSETIRAGIDQSRTDRERQQQLDAIETANEGISLISAEGRYQYVNEAYADIYGYDQSALIGEHKDLVYPDGVSFEDMVPRLRDRGQIHDEGVGQRDDGSTIPIEYTLSTTESGGFVCTTRDIADRREREQELDRKRSMLETIFDHVPAHLFIKDADGRHLRLSKCFINQRAVDSEDLYIESFDRDNIVGKTDVEISDSEHARAAYADDMHVIETGEPILDKEEHIPNEGEWNLTSKVPWRDEEGNVCGLIGISRRITERKAAQAELERQNERLEEFASVVSHDLRNPLQTARGRTEILQQRYDDDQLDVIEDAHGRMESLIEDILTIASGREESIAVEPVSLAAVVEDCWEHVTEDATSLVVETDQTITANRGRLTQLLENLIQNAVDHGGEETTITVGALDDGFFVEDDGPGIPPDKFDTVFEAGYSDAEGGTGFGLRIVQQVAEEHGWSVDLRVGTNGGARFEITGID